MNLRRELPEDQLEAPSHHHSVSFFPFVPRLQFRDDFVFIKAVMRPKFSPQPMRREWIDSVMLRAQGYRFAVGAFL